MEYLANINKILSKCDFEKINSVEGVYIANYISGVIRIFNKYNIDTSSLFSEKASTTILDSLLKEVNAN